MDIALVISVVALLIGLVNAWVNWRNRADKRNVSFVLVGTTKMVKTPSGQWRDGYPRWTLMNAGEGSVTNPEVVVAPDAYGHEARFTSAGLLPGNGSLQLLPLGDYPMPNWHEDGEYYWLGRRARVEYTDARGKKRTAVASVAQTYV